MERTKQNFPPEVEAELIAMSVEGDPRALAIKILREEVEILRRKMEDNKGLTEDMVFASGINRIKRASSYRFMLGSDISLSTFSRQVFVQVYDKPEGRQNPIHTSTMIGSSADINRVLSSAAQEVPPPPQEDSRQEQAEESSAEEYVPYQATQLACASIFLICSAALSSWFTMGVQLISPLVSIVGMIGSTTIYAMSWSARREIERAWKDNK